MLRIICEFFWEDKSASLSFPVQEAGNTDCKRGGEINLENLLSCFLRQPRRMTSHSLKSLETYIGSIFPLTTKALKELM